MYSRRSGVLLPLFSLRTKTDWGVGDLGAASLFLDTLAKAKQRMWMLLPLLPTLPEDASPYSTLSAFGLNPLYIDLHSLAGALPHSDEALPMLEEAKQSPHILYPQVFQLKEAALAKAWICFCRRASVEEKTAFSLFCQQQANWLEDLALFAALALEQKKPWWEWPAELATRQASALEKARSRLWAQRHFWMWKQWVAHSQWAKIKAKAEALDILLCGDEPFIVAHDSCDAWVNPQLFLRNGKLGAPPDDFSPEGQNWGLPYFDFEAHRATGYAWMRQRGRYASGLFHMKRVDHAVGYFRQWVKLENTSQGQFIPPEETQQTTLGRQNFEVLSQESKIIVEDLGVIPNFVHDCLREKEIPGYRVMRWARYDGRYENPHHYPEASLVTTGTHDTESLKTFWQTCQHWERQAMVSAIPELQNHPPSPEFGPALHTALLQAALNAQSRYCNFPWFDIFAKETRMNTPGTVGIHNWTCRMEQDIENLGSDENTQKALEQLAKLTQAAGR
ncbi:MAG: 4-alpha-glucanotransferase [Cystobacterineae bacterium]|nr:4-alpha-glucanotransferase [Cystobacterineae bacterium]